MDSALFWCALILWAADLSRCGIGFCLSLLGSVPALHRAARRLSVWNTWP